MFKKAIRCETSAADTPGSTTEYYGLLRLTTVTAGLNPYSSWMLIRECVTQSKDNVYVTGCAHHEETNTTPKFEFVYIFQEV